MDSPAPAVAAALASLLPGECRVAAVAIGASVATLHPEEVAATRAMAPARRVEFAAGRYCARLALAELGYGPLAVPVGPGRAPGFPPGIVGSVTHAAGLAAAAVRRGPGGLGIDLEEASDLPGEVVDRIGTRDEYASAPAGIGQGLWGRVLFSAKESVYKAVSPATSRFIDFPEVRLRSVNGPSLHMTAADGSPDLTVVARLEIRFTLVAGVVLTAAWY